MAPKLAEPRDPPPTAWRDLAEATPGATAGPPSFVRELDEPAGPAPAALIPQADSVAAVSRRSTPGLAPPSPRPVTGPAHALRERRRTRWALIALLGLTGFLLVLAVDAVLGLLADSPVLGSAAAAMLGVTVIGLAGLSLREVRQLARLDRVEATRALFDPETLPVAPALAVRQLHAAAEHLGRSPAHRGGVALWQAQVSRDHPIAEQRRLLERLVLAEADQAAVLAVRQAVRDSFVAIALSPTTLTDTVLFTWRALRLLRQIAQAYGMRPGALGLMRLLRRLVADLGTLTAADLVGDAVTHLLGDRLLDRVSVAAGEGAVGAWRMARFGLLAIERCRPIPFEPERRPGLAQVRPLLGGLTGVLETRAAGMPAGDQAAPPGGGRR